MKYEFLTERQTAKLLGLAVRTLQLWRYQKRGPRYVKLGGAVRYRLEDLERFIEAGTRETRDSALSDHCEA